MANDKSATSGSREGEHVDSPVNGKTSLPRPGDDARLGGQTVGDKELLAIVRNIGLRLAATGPTRGEAGRKLATARRSEVYAVLELLIDDVQTMTGMDDEAASKIVDGIIGDLRYILPLLPEQWPPRG